ncbi:SWI/SNF-related matrix-associated actin-dependent regulator of chromatin subfamily D member 3 [Chelonia mydas]|uniref:SWI/SNF-related matrix-associated actin-dependent regulator of chromatin subfamily D member 3 n=1 Tax=Chelonia mydas TaxID=8469 RepID=M7B2L9_CHEMY|nr:SWI/SNF-related matrix-associated actin-dependent regulator of chromatin subfamily D member 3 [Chelonia mydas]
MNSLPPVFGYSLLPPQIRELVPESQAYMDLLAFERKLDQTIMRKRVDIQEALKRPMKQKRKLRLYISNTFNPAKSDADDSDGSIASWELRVEGKLLDDISKQKRKFSSFFKSLVIELDKDLYGPDNHLVEWHRTPTTQETDGFQVKRPGDVSVRCTLLLMLDYQPPQFKLDPRLARLLGIHTQTRSAIIQALWQYIKTNKLQDSHDKEYINCDKYFQQIFDCPRLKFSEIPQRLTNLLLPPDPIVINHIISVDPNDQKKTACYDIDVEVEDPLKGQMSSFLLSTANQQEITALDNKIHETIESINQLKIQRDFMLSFSKDPKGYIQDLLRSQSRDLKGKPALMVRRSPSPAQLSLAQPTHSGDPHRSLTSWHRSLAAQSTAPPWSSYSETSESEVESYHSNRTRGRRSRSCRDHQPYLALWPPQWQPLTQWPFWTPWVYRQGQVQVCVLSVLRPTTGNASTAGSGTVDRSADTAVAPFDPSVSGTTGGYSIDTSGVKDIRTARINNFGTACLGTDVSAPSGPSIASFVLQDVQGAEGSEQDPLPSLSSSSSPDEPWRGDRRPQLWMITGFQPSRQHPCTLRSLSYHIALNKDDYRDRWQTPTSLAPMAKRNERQYFVPSKGYEHLYTHPLPDSLVVNAANQRERQGYQGPSAKNREAKRLDLFGRKIYSTGGLQLHIANQQAIVIRYTHNTCAAMAKIVELLLPQDSRSEF